MHILLVDDDADIRTVLRFILESSGHSVDEAVDGIDALEVLKTSGAQLPSAIFLDLMMPRLDGEGFLRRLRQDPWLANIPVVVISGHHGACSHTASFGAAACLVKPIELADVWAALANVQPEQGSTSSP